MAGTLQRAQHHNLHERADMQAVGSAVEPDIGRDDLLRCLFLQAFEAGRLMNGPRSEKTWISSICGSCEYPVSWSEQRRCFWFGCQALSR